MLVVPKAAAVQQKSAEDGEYNDGINDLTTETPKGSSRKSKRGATGNAENPPPAKAGRSPSTSDATSSANVDSAVAAAAAAAAANANAAACLAASMFQQVPPPCFPPPPPGVPGQTAPCPSTLSANAVPAAPAASLPGTLPNAQPMSNPVFSLVSACLLTTLTRANPSATSPEFFVPVIEVLVDSGFFYISLAASLCLNDCFACDPHRYLITR
jgi:hypothetical protein